MQLPRTSALPSTLLAAAIFGALFTTAGSAHAGVISGPGTVYTVLPGDPEEFWDVGNGATLILSPGATVSEVFATNSTVRGSGFTATDRLFGFGTSTIDVSNGRIDITSASGSAGIAGGGAAMQMDTMTITSLGRA